MYILHTSFPIHINRRGIILNLLNIKCISHKLIMQPYPPSTTLTHYTEHSGVYTAGLICVYIQLSTEIIMRMSYIITQRPK